MTFAFPRGTRTKRRTSVSRGNAKPPVITNVCTSTHDRHSEYTVEQKNARLPYREFGIWWVRMTLCDTPVGVSQSGDRKPPFCIRL
eukprot:COSAG01_NODE_2973_length_6772_cov_9.646786_4_plen_86_part_00